MRDFRAPVISDRDHLVSILSHSKQTACEFCFGNIFCWAPVYGAEISMCEHFLICRSTDDIPSFSMPKGDGDFTDCIKGLKADADAAGIPLELYAVTEPEKDMLEKMFPGEFDFLERRNDFDYIYRVEDLAALPGKKYHSKRNHIAYFEKTYNWSYEEIDSSNTDDCRKMNLIWEEQNADGKQGDLSLELQAIDRAFDNFDALSLRGGLIRVDGRVVAYTMGEQMSDDTFCTHFEKAFPDMRGAYPIINREFAINTINDFEFVDREEDMGIEGLRKAKLSYYPVTLVKKYRAKYNGDK